MVNIRQLYVLWSSWLFVSSAQATVSDFFSDAASFEAFMADPSRGFKVGGENALVKIGNGKGLIPIPTNLGYHSVLQWTRHTDPATSCVFYAHATQAKVAWKLEPGQRVFAWPNIDGALAAEQEPAPPKSVPPAGAICGARAGDKPSFEKVRVRKDACNKPAFWGRRGDGGREVCQFDASLSGPCYSFGIDREWTFDDAAAEAGCEVHGFDPGKSAWMHFDYITPLLYA
jgi:hypothetical protein